MTDTVVTLVTTTELTAESSSAMEPVTVAVSVGIAAVLVRGSVGSGVPVIKLLSESNSLESDVIIVDVAGDICSDNKSLIVSLIVGVIWVGDISVVV